MKFRVTPSHYDPYRVGYRRVTMLFNNKKQKRNLEQILNNNLVRIGSLQLETIKLKPLVVTVNYAVVNMCLGYVQTARHMLANM